MQERSTTKQVENIQKRGKKNVGQEQSTSQETTKRDQQQPIASAKSTGKKQFKSIDLNDDAIAENSQLMVPNVTKPSETNLKSKSSKSETKSAVPWYLQE